MLYIDRGIFQKMQLEVYKKIWNFYSSYELNFVGILIPSVISIIILNCGIISSWIVYLFLGLIRILAKGYLYIFKEKKEKKI